VFIDSKYNTARWL